MELKIHIRQQRFYNSQNQEIYWQGTNPTDLQVVVGQLPAGDPRRWRNYPDWINVTDNVSDLHKLRLIWSDQRNETGELVGETRLRKGTSGTITFEGEAYELLRRWLVDDVSAQVNGVEVVIEHVGVGYYRNYRLRYSDIGWCEDASCTFDTNIKQMDERLSCIKRTMITDNHLGWFPKQGEKIAPNKKHPRFAYCVEKDSGTLSAIWYLLCTTVGTMYPMITVMATVYNSIAFIINGIEAAVNAIISIVGGNPVNWGFEIITWSDIATFWGSVMSNSAGCGREHPAPLIRDYIYNVCKKCGVTVNAETAPIFFDQNPLWRTSDPRVGDKGEYNAWNPYYNACYFHPAVRRGIRRYDRWDAFDNPVFNTEDYWIPDNEPMLTLDMFLNQISPVFNMQWMVHEGKLYINRKDWFIERQPLFDFRGNGADASRIIEGVCFENTEKTYPAWTKGIWNTDSSDACGSQAAGQNGTGQANAIIEFGNTDNNPNFEGVLDKTVASFGFARFRFDGVASDYVYDAAQMVFNAGITSHIIPLSRAFFEAFMEATVQEIDKYNAYSILMSGEITSLPKIIIWDGQSYEAAKAWRGYKAGNTTVDSRPMPPINSYYNSGGTPWHQAKNVDTTVTGSKLVFADQRKYNYEVYRGMGVPILGMSNPVANHTALLVNYPMFFEHRFRETLWDRFHWIDDPRRTITMNRTFRVKIELCVDALNILKVFNDASEIMLNHNVLLDHGYAFRGKIREIEVSYNPDGDFGRYIEISGTL